ncbi:hypothetical protein CMUST_15690 (plasmid) [Corynebacterium mustelae]|uniref:Uncharacterized protein n=1 Tax=Corynebacterium mustelae TaxID=571915 RepID=A0A0G3H1Y5_9CORY|nr:hypothetical protein [Corynebacterium mustelae]AKK05248.1 hypothetical protein CMUST_04530 [Corynebacterium mustelae]AKK07426.1 hypothetical protein CMUST_15690 [Corynebacterium mustelae]
MIRTDVVLYASGGEMTVGRRVATHVYGAFEVVLPEGQEQHSSVVDPRIQNGYICRPFKPVAPGRFNFGFVRADVTLNLQSQSSDLERVVDAAQERVSGDVFFERDIGVEGLGRFVPTRHFDVGDTVSVAVWGLRVPAVVTGIDAVSDAESGLLAWRVHVGGQLVSDLDAVSANNEQIRRQIAQERAQRLREAGALSTKVASVESKAEEAESKAAQAGESAEAAMRRAIAANTEASAANARAIRTNQFVLSGMPRLLHIDTNKTNAFTSSAGELNNGADFGYLLWTGGLLSPQGEVTFTATGAWTGAILMHAVTGDGYSDVTTAFITADTRSHVSIAGALFQNYKSATVWIFPNPTV